MTATIQETIATLQDTLQGYIEATYHIADPRVVEQRRRLLQSSGGIFQTPFLESTPRYVTGDRYAAMTDIPGAAREAYVRLASSAQGKPLLFDPPYRHQAESIRAILRDQRNVMIMTGTGSGKTESFLLPILGKLAIEASDKSEQFAAHSAARAMVLYPMNALVNDQLGRLRLLFGDERVIQMFQQWSGRAATFARYTSRTPYAGVRTRGKDRTRLRSIGDFFVAIEDAARRHAAGTPIVEAEDARAAALIERLRVKGKWPAKPSVSDWFGTGYWMSGNAFRRAVALDDDAELMTRWEVQQAPPDLLITNYSMLEYMMLRPIERSIFDATRAWLEACPEEKFLIVLDEAHLYRGAQGAEVGLLLRRLRERLGIPPERFQVICATASFSDAGKASAGEFGAQLTGVDAQSFVPVTGDLKLREGAAKGSVADLALLAAVDLDGFFSEDAAQRAAAIVPFLAARGIAATTNDATDLFHALADYPPFALLVNETMRRAGALDEIRDLVFDAPDRASGDRAINALLAMGSRARLKADDASLLPCRVHAFHRGLPGLWACMDPGCTELAEGERGGPIGKLYAQPRDRCGCQAPVLAYYTCRYCGTSYARAYTKDVARPDHLFAEPGQKLITSAGVALAFQPLDLLLETPANPSQGVAAHYDLASGLLNPNKLSERHRLVYLRPQASSLAAAPGTDSDDDDEDDDGSAGAGPGQFVPCGCCGRSVRGGKSSVQDHLTKGDQPFQALVSAQIRVQPPSPVRATEFAPLRGRKVLVFSDSRQVAARLAPALQVYSLKDTLRALLPLGYRMLSGDPVFATSIVLDNAWLATVVAAHRLGVRLRPELEGSETMPRVFDTPPGAMPDTKVLISLLNAEPPANLIRALVDVLRDNILGLESLAVASIGEANSETGKIAALPALAGIAEAPEDKLAVARAWLRAWSRKSGIWFRGMPNSWWGTGGVVRSHKGDFRAMQHVLGTPALRKDFKKEWLPRLMPMVTELADGGNRLLARKLSLRLGGEWRRCARCTSVHRPIATVPACIDCGSPDVHIFDPDNDPVFRARKGFYRGPVVEALGHDEPKLMSLIAAEHTAQLNAARADTAFSQAEHHEMQFQDIDLAWRDVDQGHSTSIDVLSSTTTMEVGIDIGDLSGVALRNMPPGRANYQQRAGRAGRRGNAVATVVAFGSADSHDDHYFTRPQEMIRGQVVDPRLTLENPDIARRHIRAFLLQRYHEAKLPALNLADPGLANLFSVLGTVGDFLGTGPLNHADLQVWLNANEPQLREAIARWLPAELSDRDRDALLEGFSVDLLSAVDMALEGQRDAAPSSDPEEVEVAGSPPWIAAPVEASSPDEEPPPDADPEPDNDGGVDAAADNLLDRLLYWGVLPRYAFPTDVAPFYVFSPNSTGYRAEMEFAPSQGLNIALSQYAPNKQIWIKGKQYTSKAIYSPFPDDRRVAWGRKRLYYECERCGHAKTDDFYDPSKRGELLTCVACHTPNSFGPAKPWFRPPGFAHLWKTPAPSVPDEPNETAYATRAKLVMTTDRIQLGEAITPHLRAIGTRQHLLVSNSGPDGEGYDYCVRCGRIESSVAPEVNLSQPHPLPYPNDNDPPCPGFSSRGIVLGTDFLTDIALFSLRIETPFRLPPAHSETISAMRTVCEALAKAASLLLEIEAGEILAEYRPALNEHGAAGSLVEVFLYDTLAGGAGFSPQLAPRGRELFELALQLLELCPEQCDSSCYRCLRSFKNKLDHALLDRFVGAQLLRHVLDGGPVPFDHARAFRSLAILAADLERQLPSDYVVQRHFGEAGATAPIILSRKNGSPIRIDIHSPIAPGVPVFGTSNAILVDDLRIRRHLGEEVEKVLQAI
ncbi:MAG: DEAD/DEAH box helicase [Rhizobiales bacterium]|nr:DEAD/DEAH box helicase [Hyphomicrobiales bacterium]